MAELGVSQPLEQRDGQTDSRAENNAADCIRIEWEAGRYLGKKVAAEKEEETSVSVWSSRADRDWEGAAGQKDRQPDR